MICGDVWNDCGVKYACVREPGHAGNHEAYDGPDGDPIATWRPEVRVTIHRAVDVALEDLTVAELEAWAARLNADEARSWVVRLMRPMVRGGK